MWASNMILHGRDNASSFNIYYEKKKKRLNHTLPVAVHDMPYPSEPWAKRKCYSGAFLVMISLSPPLMNSYY